MGKELGARARLGRASGKQLSAAKKHRRRATEHSHANGHAYAPTIPPSSVHFGHDLTHTSVPSRSTTYALGSDETAASTPQNRRRGIVAADALRAGEKGFLTRARNQSGFFLDELNDSDDRRDFFFLPARVAALEEQGRWALLSLIYLLRPERKSPRDDKSPFRKKVPQ